MIQIGLTTAMFIYGTVIVVLAIFLYFVSELRAARVYHTLERQFLWRCAFCNFLYLDESAAHISQCPRCESYNTGVDAQDKAVSVAKQRFQQRPDETHQPDEEMPRRNPSRRKRPQSRRRGPRRRR